MHVKGNIKEPADFLKAIGRGCDEFADKFEESIDDKKNLIIYAQKYADHST